MPPFEPQNMLETLLLKAAQDPGARPDFYRAFLDSDLLILGEIVEEGRLYIREVQDGDQRLIPCFSSLQRVQEYLQTSEKVVRLKGAALIDIVGDAAQIVLNPNAQVGKLFVHAELRGLRDGSIFQQTQDLPLQAGQRILLTLPPHPPQRFVESLTSLYGQRPQVQRAYLAQMQTQLSEQPTLLVALVASEQYTDDPELRGVISDSALIARETLIPGALVNYMRLVDTDMQAYFARIAPFYERSS